MEVYNSELMAKKEQLEETRTKVHKWLRGSHVTEQIQQKQQISEELAKKSEVELGYELMSKLVIIPTGI